MGVWRTWDADSVSEWAHSPPPQYKSVQLLTLLYGTHALICMHAKEKKKKKKIKTSDRTSPAIAVQSEHGRKVRTRSRDWTWAEIEPRTLIGCIVHPLFVRSARGWGASKITVGIFVNQSINQPTNQSGKPKPWDFWIDSRKKERRKKKRDLDRSWMDGWIDVDVAVDAPESCRQAMNRLRRGTRSGSAFNVSTFNTRFDAPLGFKKKTEEARKQRISKSLSLDIFFRGREVYRTVDVRLPIKSQTGSSVGRPVKPENEGTFIHSERTDVSICPWHWQWSESFDQEAQMEPSTSPSPSPLLVLILVLVLLQGVGHIARGPWCQTIQRENLTAWLNLVWVGGWVMGLGFRKEERKRNRSKFQRITWIVYINACKDTMVYVKSPKKKKRKRKSFFNSKAKQSNAHSKSKMQEEEQEEFEERENEGKYTYM